MILNHINLALNIQLPLRREMFEGREHIVAPVVALVEGVHNEFFYSASELAKFTDCWNGIPLPVQHPEISGQPVSANTPQLIEKQSVGRLFNVRFDSAKKGLVGELWVDVAKAKKISPAVLDAINSGKPLDVSTALFTDGDKTPGEWNGEKYTETVINFRPDHLALLPGGTGACSWADGCGVRANKKNDDTPGMLEKMRDFFKTMAAKMGFAVQEISHDDIRYKLQTAINSLDNPGWMHFIREVYDNEFIYEAVSDNPSEAGGPASTIKLYKLGYSVNEDGEVTVADGPQEVVEKTEYVPVDNANKDNKTLSSKEDKTMEKAELIKSLIACPHNALTADHEEWLKGLDDCQLKAMAYVEPEKAKDDKGPDEPKKPEPKTDDKEPDPKSNADEPKKPATVDEYIANAPAEVQSVLNRAVARDRAVKADLIKGLMANKRNKFTEEQLKAKDIAELETLAELGQVDVDYSLSRGTPSVTDNAKDRPPEPPVVFELNKAKEEPAKKTA